MLNHLFATILICMGVANTTPISNYDQKESNLVLTTPKKENITANYTISLNWQSYAESANYQQVPVQNGYHPYSTYRQNEKYNINAGNNYLSIIGNIYRTNVAAELQDENNENVNVSFIENKEMIGDDLDFRIQERTEILYIYKITPYNYNIDTRIRIRQYISLSNWTDSSDIDWYTYQNYLIKNVYTTTQENWDQYINQQIVQYQAYKIARDIENVDNGFYYAKEQNLIQVGQNTTQDYYVDEWDINIIPNIDNYIVVEYIPCVRAVNMGEYQNTQYVVPIKGRGITPEQGSNITGTNIIPDGTYEVVDIPGIMFEVIGMPFAFVSQAFNLTLFPGTPYQINIANLFLSIAAIFVFVWLLLLFIKMKG